tara:strand:- start:298 stop:597 length:300 start_codon:yes stop_codon:yes gene_type:complete
VINVTEVFEEVVKTPTESSIGTLLIKTKKKLSTRDILINPNYIVRVMPHEYTSSTEVDMLKEAGLDRKQFSRIILDGNNFVNSEIVVASSFNDIEKALK